MSAYSWNTLAQRQTTSMTLTLLSHPATGPLHRMHCSPEHAVSLFLSPGPSRAQGWYGARPQSEQLRRLGSLVVVPADIPMHVYLPETPPRTLFCCRFDRDYFRAATGFEEHWESAALRACSDVRDSSIEKVLRRLAEEIEAPGFAGETLISGLSLVFLAEIARYLRHNQGHLGQRRGGLAPWQLRRIRESIEDCPEQQPTVEDLARLCSIGGRHLMRAFKQSTGQTIMEFVQQVRIRRAEYLLADTDLPLPEIAARLGFSHYSAFSAAFRRVVGETPRAFRQRHGGAMLLAEPSLLL